MKGKMRNKFRGIYTVLNNSNILQAIRESLIMIFPVIMVGAFALVLRSFPVSAYISFIQNFAGGIIDRFLQYLYLATFGVMSLYMVISLAVCYINKLEKEEGNYLGAVFSSLVFFGFMSGMFNDNADALSCIGVNAIFTGIVSALLATGLYHFFLHKIRWNIHFYTSGAGENYHHMLEHITPIILVSIVAEFINIVIKNWIGAESFQEIYSSALGSLFAITGRNFSSALLYVFILHLLWFFGIHGGNVMEAVHNTCFVPALDINIAAVAQGGVPTEIYSKTFFDAFVLMGGCGSTLCLLLAILLFEKRKTLHKLAKFSIAPSIFNINELLVFGIPIVFNPILFIPFFLTPVSNLLISTVAMKIGLVPLVTHGVEWTTPIFFGGYVATGSIAGIILQAVNLVTGVMIYRPFINLLNRENERDSREKMNKLMDILCESEKTRIPVNLLKLRGDMGSTAKFLSAELEDSFFKGKPPMYYQPQYDSEGHCIGAEALLRWNHPVYGMVYPPLVIKLLEEMGQLTRAEKSILRSVFMDMDAIKKTWGEDTKISINVTGVTIQLDEFEDFLGEMKQRYPEHIFNIMLEITEQASLQIDTELIERLSRIKKMGYRFAIDDFSMGNTSVKYLKSNVFDMIKLDGSLTRDIMTNDRSRGIVKTLAKMAEEFNLQILAEYVETEDQKKLLENMGCYLYQGYLYSPAIPLEEFID